MRITRRHLLWTGLLLVAALSAATALFAAQTTLCWEGEDAQGITGKAWLVKPYKVDPSGKVSNKTVLRLPHYDKGEKPPKDECSFKVNVPEKGVYYLWARVFWKDGCGNSFFISVGNQVSDSIMGGDGTYNIMHWICLNDAGDNESRPMPLKLDKGVVTITVGAKESNTMIDQFVLTTDRKYIPANIVKPTPNVLAKPDAKDKEKK